MSRFWQLVGSIASVAILVWLLIEAWKYDHDHDK